jgi:hypothetical protein
MAVVAWIVYGALTLATVVLLPVTYIFGHFSSSMPDLIILWGILGFLWLLAVVLHVLWRGGGQE